MLVHTNQWNGASDDFFSSKNVPICERARSQSHRVEFCRIVTILLQYECLHYGYNKTLLKSYKMSCNMPFWELDLRGLECSKWAQILTGYGSTFLLHYCEEKSDFLMPSRKSMVSKLGPWTLLPATKSQWESGRKPIRILQRSHRFVVRPLEDGADSSYFQDP